MSTHKRKGRDFLPSSVATVVDPTRQKYKGDKDYNQSPERMALNQEWSKIILEMDAMRAAWQTRSVDPMASSIQASSIQQVVQQPRLLQERMDNWQSRATDIHKSLDKEFSSLQNRWKIQSENQFERQQRLTALEGRSEALALELQDVRQTVQHERDALARQRDTAARHQQTAKQSQEALVGQVERLKQKISMYAHCTGIKLDDENVDQELTGNVAVPSQETYKHFSFSRGNVKQEEMMDQIWALMEGREVNEQGM